MAARTADTVHDWGVALGDLARAVWRGRAAWRLPVAPDPDSRCRDVPIVILPGILEPWTYLAPMARWLSDRGHPVEFVETLGWNLADLDASAERCLRVLRQRGTSGAVLVAHSKGGLIGKAVLLAQGDEAAAVGMVAVATPFAGSTVGRRLHRLVARSPLGLFAPGNPVLQALADEVSVNAHIVSLSPAWDQMIPGGSHLAGATNVDLAAAGHFRPVRDEAVWEVIHEHAHRLADEAAGDG
ncbi:hypothetical protein SAMN04488242_1684 [Tessaracoccus oleiagri]|uniref:Alpha/beta hydrolase family protein n=2 Tax=Tessaracoccus oleiagri TaxID=686624 RepID=A0A1G9KJZ4_9ACTN|nr:hypothetical protein SAMN04488242_1684 [Tessaracoccus oleiagri]